MRHTAGTSLVAAWAAAHVNAAEGGAPKRFFKLRSIGKVEKQGQGVRLRIFDEYVDGLLGLEHWSHVNVFYWFDQNDTPQQRRVLRVHPRRDRQNPLTGVFACRAPVRPNLIAMSVCKILSVQGNLVTLDDLDAFDATPVLDLKPFIPPDAPTEDVRVPAWARQRRTSGPRANPVPTSVDRGRTPKDTP
jgi:tRNA-Thr(GGU) m(6)t(6)A37 methyltransferase TsaA